MDPHRVLHITASTKLEIEQIYTTGDRVNKLYCNHTMKQYAAIKDFVALYCGYENIFAACLSFKKLIITAWVAWPYLENDIQIYTCVRKGEEIQHNVNYGYLQAVGLQEISYISADIYSKFYTKKKKTFLIMSFLT